MNQNKVKLIPVTPLQQNCALIWDAESRQAAVVDPGGNVPQIVEAIRREGVTVQAIYLTHGHLDHAGGAMALARQLDAEIIGPDRRDEFLLDRIATQAAAYGLAGMENVTPDRWLAEGERVTLGGRDFEVLHCPGHTPGHVVFVDRDGGFGVFGDVLFRGSVGRFDFPYGDGAALIEGIKTKLLPLPDEFAFVCGHGPNSTIGSERRRNPFLR